jgi:hypothetical protein
MRRPCGVRKMAGLGLPGLGDAAFQLAIPLGAGIACVLRGALWPMCPALSSYLTPVAAPDREVVMADRVAQLEEENDEADFQRTSGRRLRRTARQHRPGCA